MRDVRGSGFGFVFGCLTDASAGAAAPQIDELDVLVEGGARKGLEPLQKVVRLLRKVDIVAAVNLHFDIFLAKRPTVASFRAVPVFRRTLVVPAGLSKVFRRSLR